MMTAKRQKEGKVKVHEKAKAPVRARAEEEEAGGREVRVLVGFGEQLTTHDIPKSRTFI